MERLGLEAIEARDALSRGKMLTRTDHGGLLVELLRYKGDM